MFNPDLWSLGVLHKTQSWKSCSSALTSTDFWSSASCFTDRLPQHVSVHKRPFGQQRSASSGQGPFAADDFVCCYTHYTHVHAITPGWGTHNISSMHPVRHTTMNFPLASLITLTYLNIY